MTEVNVSVTLGMSVTMEEMSTTMGEMSKTVKKIEYVLENCMF